MEAAIAARPQRPGWDGVFAEHYPGLVRHLSHLLGDRAAAEDVAQEAFVRLMRRPPPRDGDMSGLLRVTARRLAYNYLRGERRRRAREEAQAHDPALGAAGPAPAEGDADVRGALDRLAPRDRLAVLLRASGASYAELADALGMPVSSVGTTLARATRRLRAAYAAAQGTSGEGDGDRGARR